MKKFLAVISMTMMLVAAMFTGCSGGSADVLQEGEHATLRLMAGGTQWQGDVSGEPARLRRCVQRRQTGGGGAGPERDDRIRRRDGYVVYLSHSPAQRIALSAPDAFRQVQHPPNMPRTILSSI